MTSESNRDSFARAYNLRRKFAKAACGVVSALLILRLFPGLEMGRWAGVLRSDISAMLGVIGFVWANYLLCRCPACKRFIGLMPTSLRGLPRGAPCEAENRYSERLDWPGS